MKHFLCALLITALAASFSLAGTGAEIGDTAPDFTLPDVRTEAEVTLSDFRGQVVVLQIWKCN